MASTELQWIDVVGKLIRLTKEGEQVWEASQGFYSVLQESDERIESVFHTTYQGKKLRLYERIYKAYRYKHEITGAPIHDPYLAREVVLEIVDDLGMTLWRFPKLNIIRALLSSVQFKVSGAKELLSHV